MKKLLSLVLVGGLFVALGVGCSSETKTSTGVTKASGASGAATGTAAPGGAAAPGGTGGTTK